MIWLLRVLDKYTAMTNHLKFLSFSSLCILLCSCSPKHPKGTFGYDQKFLKNHQEIITLKENNDKSQLIVLPDLQGRVITSTSGGLKGNSYGWMHYDLIASGAFEEHFNPFGGEDRFWIGPEGGQFSIFFKKGTAFTFDNWFTPKELDTEPFDVINQTNKEVVFRKKMQLVNYQEYTFDIEVNRTVTIFEKKQIEEELGIDITNKIDYVAYQSNNEIVNIGDQSWAKESGLLSIWILGMYIPSKNTTVILPYRDSLTLNSSYFGSIPPDRLTITDKHVMFKGDGTHRFKLGLPPQNIMPFIGSFDADKQILTIVSYTFEEDNSYVNSVWRSQKNPYQGDVINSYNDGPLENGEQLGPFYELESSSGVKELKPGESINHVHKTYHFEGNLLTLNEISKQLLGKDLNNLP